MYVCIFRGYKWSQLCDPVRSSIHLLGVKAPGVNLLGVLAPEHCCQAIAGAEVQILVCVCICVLCMYVCMTSLSWYAVLTQA